MTVMHIEGGPDYFERTFPKDAFPVYDWVKRPEFLPNEVWTTETTHRDGQQGGIPLTTEDACAIYDIQCAFTKDSGAIRQAEFFVYSESDRRALESSLDKYKSGAPIQPTTWIRAKRDDVELIKQIGVTETGMLASASDFHTFHKFKPGGRQQAAEIYLDAVKTCLDLGIRPRLHLEDASRAHMDFIKPFIEAVIQVCETYGEALCPKIRVCDTMGLALPYESVDLPRSVPAVFKVLRGFNLKPEQLEFHPHNDTWMIVPNCIAAIMNGCGAINGTCLGKGERTGNAPLEAVIMHLLGMGYFGSRKMDFKALNKLADLYEKIGHGLPNKYPLYGRDAHRTRAGIHADGINKFWWMYAPFNVPDLLGRPLEVSLTKDSGVAGLQFLISQHLGLNPEKTDPRLISLNKQLQDAFKNGRMTAIEWEEIADQVVSLFGTKN